MKDRVFIIAEAGVNHNGCMEMAKELIDVAMSAGADAVKFQTYISEQVMTRYVGKAGYQEKNTGCGGSHLEMSKKLELSFEQFEKLKKYCDTVGILFLSTPFDHDSVDFLDHLVPLYKIPSGEITNLPLLAHIARKNKPVIMSTGMSNLEEIDRAVALLRRAGHPGADSPYPPLTLLHCTSNYPTAFADANLRAIQTMQRHFADIPIGYSDHTVGIEAAIAAVALGARVIEKHFTLNRNLAGPDHKASIEPQELHQLVLAIRNVEAAMGSGEKVMVPCEREIRDIARRSLAAAADLKAGTVLTENMVAIKRPGTGISPVDLSSALGKRLKHHLHEDEVITWDDLEL
ncbi:MAG: N-acetylneuraminate synthase [Victivallales bacterium]|nr:N-acetylneuraminate synthase [Victivallales bacterium]